MTPVREDTEDRGAEAAKAAEAAKKKKKRAPVLRSQIIFDLKPIDTEVDLEDLAEKIKDTRLGDEEVYANKVKEINDARVTLDNICEWGEGHKIVPIAFGICKVQVSCCVIDDVTGIEDIQDFIEQKFGEQIQSIDVCAMNKANAIK